MKLFLVVLPVFSIVFSLLVYRLVQNGIFIKNKHPDFGLRVPEIVTKNGYPIEIHEVITEDGYILNIHRIPHGKNNANKTNKPVVFLFHGLICSSAVWVYMGPEKGLAYLLADRGYDVWMGNTRGNTYSRNHVQYNPDLDRKQFWNFSWHEMGNIDLPTMIDYVIDKTGIEKVLYIGHSQGVSCFFVMVSERPEYNDKVQLMVGLGPVVYANHTRTPIVKIIVPIQHPLEWIVEMMGLYEILPSTKFMQHLSHLLCNDESILQEICISIIFLLVGYDEAQFNTTMAPVILSNLPAGASAKQLFHFLQLYTSGEFQQYDYGSDNEKHYGPGVIQPPKYNLENIKVPVELFYGEADFLCVEEDVMRLRESLPHVIKTYKIKYPLFTHLDFLSSVDVVKLLYNDIFDVLSRYV